MLTELQKLSLGNNRELKAAGVKALADALLCLPRPSSLTHLDLCRSCGDDDPSGPAAAESLAAALSRLTALRHLDLRTNDGFGAEGNKAIAHEVGLNCPNLVRADMIHASTSSCRRIL